MIMIISNRFTSNVVTTSNLSSRILLFGYFVIGIVVASVAADGGYNNDNGRYNNNEVEIFPLSDPNIILSSSKTNEELNVQQQTKQNKEQYLPTQQQEQQSWIIGTLHPSDLPGPEIFTNWQPPENQTVAFGTAPITYASGSVPQSTANTSTSNHNTTADVTFSVLSSLLDRKEVKAILTLLRNYEKELDDDPDTVDGMPSYEIFVDSPDLRNYDDNDEKNVNEMAMKYRDYDDRKERTILREKLQAILRPILKERITPFVQWRYPNLCNQSMDRTCTACYSLIRRYRYNERTSHAPHHDGHAIVTAVTSLSDYNVNYRGGLYVVSPNSDLSTNSNDTIPNREAKKRIKTNFRYLGLNAGDTAVHTSALLHGVKVYNKIEEPKTTERWSWIVWFRDSDCHNDYSNEWFQQCAMEGDAICQQLHSTKVTTSEEIFHWNLQAAHNGAGTAAVKIARAYLQELKTSVSIAKNTTKAMEYFQMSIRSHNNPEGHYGMAQLLIDSVTTNSNKKKNQKSTKWMNRQLQKAIYHLENAAIAGHVFAMFNLGIAHTYGYGIFRDGTVRNNNDEPIMNAATASAWFIESGLPEGYYTASFYYQSIGDKKRYKLCIHRATQLGYFAPWRIEARKRTGSGGIGSVDINLNWPISMDGRIPPKF